MVRGVRTRPPISKRVCSATSNYVGSVVYLYGLYTDKLEEGKEGWRTVRRDLVFLGPGFVGNLSLADVDGV